MPERIREVTVTIEVDTNKQTYSATLKFQHDESRAEFEQRIVDKLAELMEDDA